MSSSAASRPRRVAKRTSTPAAPACPAARRRRSTRARPPSPTPRSAPPAAAPRRRGRATSRPGGCPSRCCRRRRALSRAARDALLSEAGGLRVVRRQALVGEEVRLSGIDEERRLLDLGVELAARSRGRPRAEEANGSSSMRWICSRTPAGHGPPNACGSTQECNSTAPRAPGRVCASFCAGSTPSEKPMGTSPSGRSSAPATPRAMTVSKPIASACAMPSSMRLERSPVVEVRRVHDVAHAPHPLAEGAHARRQALGMVEDQQLGHPGSVCRTPECGSDVPGDTHREEHLVKYVILIHSNPQPWGHPTSDFLPEHQALPDEQRERCMRPSSGCWTSCRSAASCSAGRPRATRPRPGCTAGRR